MARLPLTIAALGGTILALTGCGGPSPATSTAIEQANRSADATFGAARSATITVIASTDTAFSAARRPSALSLTPVQGSAKTGSGAATTTRSTPNLPVEITPIPPTVPPTPTTAAPTPTTMPTPIGPSVVVANERTPMPPTTVPTATSVPTSTAMPTPTAPPAVVAYERLLTAVATVDTGEIDAALDYGNQARTVTSVRFALGRGKDLARTQTTVMYQSTVATRSAEAITIGGQTWQRADGTSWAATDRTDNARDQVRALFPRAGADGVKQEERDGAAVLRWYDADHASDVEVMMDATTGIPRQMRQISRADGSVLTVTYRSWNAPVTITAPDRS